MDTFERQPAKKKETEEKEEPQNVLSVERPRHGECERLTHAAGATAEMSPHEGGE